MKKVIDAIKAINPNAEVVIRGDSVDDCEIQWLEKTSEISKVMSPSRIVFGFEGDATNQQVGLGNDGVDSNLIRKLNQKL